MRERTNIVDLCKLFFALCIVAMHTSLLNQFSEGIYWYVMHLVFRLAVPFFFVSSGYFFGKKFIPVSDSKSARMIACKRYARRLLPGFV